MLPAPYLVLEITSDVPEDGGELENLRFLLRSVDGEAAFPASLDDLRLRITEDFDPTSEMVTVALDYIPETLGARGEAYLQIVGTRDGQTLASFNGRVTLAEHRTVIVHLEGVPGDCDLDGDGFLDCANPVCGCADDEVWNDCAPSEAVANPWMTSFPCDLCGRELDCPGADVACADSDQDGALDCEEVVLCADTTAVDRADMGPGEAEVCDGIDNNCDGIVDDVGDVPCQTSNTFGTCSGFQICFDGTLTTCTARVPSAEDCDGLDNDCDGVVDEGCGTGQDLDGDGVSVPEDCDDHDAGVFPLFDGMPSHETCCLHGTPEGEGCDRDCDGEFVWCDEEDEDGDGVVAADDCNDDDASVFPGAPERCGDDIDQDCFGGDLACAGVIDDDGDQWPDTVDCDDSDPSLHPWALEVCNGVDDDCDGIADQGNPGGGGVCESDVGACESGTVVCSASQADNGESPYLCVDFAGPSQEICDGLDNDCDGLVDDELGTVTCGLGACAHEVSACSDGTENLCDPLSGASPEVCDGIDNDCDGVVDNGLFYQDEAANTDPRPVGAPCGFGACTGGTVVCTATGGTTCSSLDNKSQEICNGEDDDCNNIIDDPWTMGLASLAEGLYDVDEGSALGEPCGSGICAGGEVICSPDGLGLVCSTDDLIQLEVCDGIDNDCDGLIDAADPDDLVGSDKYICPVQQGVCQGATVSPLACTSGQWSACSAVDYQNHSDAWEPQEVTCDGLDNDCDGSVDEYLDTNVSCGLGICEHTVSTCHEGAPQTCDPFLGAEPETCADVTDENCNGQVNEGCPLVAHTCTVPGVLSKGQKIVCGLGNDRMVERIQLSVGCNDGEIGKFNLKVDGVLQSIFWAECCTGKGENCSSDFTFTVQPSSEVEVKMKGGFTAGVWSGGLDSKISIEKFQVFYR